jgi:hypothetical protein
MNNIFDAIKWFIRNFFFITIAVFVIIYLRWFRLTPFVFLDDPSEAFIGGFVLLIIYGVLSKLLSLTKGSVLKAVLFIASIIFLYINALYLNIHMPRIVSTSKCDGITYYVTHNKPLLDEQWSYIQLSKWKGVINYESHFQGYAPGVTGDQIICDK